MQRNSEIDHYSEFKTPSDFKLDDSVKKKILPDGRILLVNAESVCVLSADASKPVVFLHDIPKHVFNYNNINFNNEIAEISPDCFLLYHSSSSKGYVINLATKKAHLLMLTSGGAGHLEKIIALGNNRLAILSQSDSNPSDRYVTYIDNALNKESELEWLDFYKGAGCRLTAVNGKLVYASQWGHQIKGYVIATKTEEVISDGSSWRNVHEMQGVSEQLLLIEVTKTFIERQLFLIDQVKKTAKEIVDTEGKMFFLADITTYQNVAQQQHYAVIPSCRSVPYNAEQQKYIFKHYLEVINLATAKHEKTIPVSGKVESLCWQKTGKLDVLLTGKNESVSFSLAEIIEHQKLQQTPVQKSTKSTAFYLGAVGLFAAATAYMAFSKQSSDLCPTTSCMLNGFQ